MGCCTSKKDEDFGLDIQSQRKQFNLKGGHADDTAVNTEGRVVSD